MASLQSAQPVLSLIVGMVLGLATGGLLTVRLRKQGSATTSRGEDDLLIFLLALAAFGLGSFLSYVFI